MYHITDIKKYIKCSRLYYYEKDGLDLCIPDEYIKVGIKIGSGSYKVVERNDKNERFFDNVDKYEYFIHSRFEDHDLRINIPFMHKVEGGFDLCFVYNGVQIKELDLLTYRICVRMLKKLGIEVKQIYMIYLNGEYVYENQIDVDQLFICTNKYKDDEIINITRQGDYAYETVIDTLNKNHVDAPKKNRSCRMFGLCSHYYECFPNEEKLESDSILTLVSSKNKNKTY